MDHSYVWPHSKKRVSASAASHANWGEPLRGESIDLRLDHLIRLIIGTMEAQIGRGPAERGETVFAVNARDPELVEIIPDTAFLSQLVSLFGDRGALRPSGNLDGPLVDEQAMRRVEDRQEVPLATAPVVALFFGLLSSLAWWLRRLAGGR